MLNAPQQSETIDGARVPLSVFDGRARRSGQDRPFRNGLLRALPTDALNELRPSMKRVSLKRRQVLQERNLPLSYAYFIEEGAASLLSRSGDSAGVEIATLGRFDFIGIPLVLGTCRSPHRCVVHIPGQAVRISAEDLVRAVQAVPAVRALLLGYVQAAMVHTAQIALCNSRHSLQQRLARWLLTAQDQLDAREISVTHQCLSRALGVRRAGVTTAVGRMEADGLLQRGRGVVAIADRAGVESQSCECYRAIRSEHQRILCEPVAERLPEAPVLPLRRAACS